MNIRFLNLLLQSGALKFGDFTTKSGRKSPYFVNTGCFDNGKIFSEVSLCYAEILDATNLINSSTVLFGPAYKGIPLVVGVAMTLAQNFNQTVGFCFNRKEQKDHGEGGRFVGAPLSEETDIIIVEDVLTQGTSVQETLQLLAEKNLKPSSVVVGVDREEFGFSKVKLAGRELEDQGIKVFSLLKISEVIDFLSNQDFVGKRWIDQDQAKRIQSYREQYCRQV